MGLSLRGATSGAIDINAPDVAGDNTITLPPNNGSANQFFKNSGTAGIVTYSSMVETSAGDVGVIGKLEIGPSGGIGATIFADGGVVTGAGATFADFVLSGEADAFEARPTSDGKGGGRISPFSVQVSRSAPGVVFSGRDITEIGAGSNDFTSYIYGDGSANFGGKVEVGPTAGIACTISAAGAITAASNITIGTYPNGNGTRVYPSGGVTVRKDSIAAVYEIYNGAVLAANRTFSVSSDGSITVADNKFRVLSTGNTKLGDLDSASATATGIDFYSSGEIASQISGAITPGGTVGLSMRHGTTEYLKVLTDGSIDAAGRADIGTTSLDDYAVAGFSNSASYGGIYAQNNNASGNLFTGYENTNEVFKVTSGGAMTAAAGNFDLSTGGGIAIKGALNIGDETYTNAGNGGAFTYANGGTIVYKSNETFNNSDTTVFISGYSAADTSTAKTQKFWVDTAGNATFSGAVKIGGTVAANQIDEYEEGTWTPVPTFGGGNNGINGTFTGYYIRVGSLVNAFWRLTFLSKGTSTGSFSLSGQPFTITGVPRDGTSFSYIHRLDIQTVDAGDQLFGYMTGAPSMTLYVSGGTGAQNAAALTNADFSNSTDLTGCTTYRIS